MTALFLRHSTCSLIFPKGSSISPQSGDSKHMAVPPVIHPETYPIGFPRNRVAHRSSHARPIANAVPVTDVLVMCKPEFTVDHSQSANYARSREALLAATASGYRFARQKDYLRASTKCLSRRNRWSNSQEHQVAIGAPRKAAVWGQRVVSVVVVSCLGRVGYWNACEWTLLCWLGSMCVWSR